MPRISLVNTVHHLLRNHLNNGDIAIDATLGNGHDTVFLAQKVAPNGQVYGFDIQQVALDATAKNCQTYDVLQFVSLLRVSHAKMAEYIPITVHGKIKAILFNLGYLPGGDKQVITQTTSTLSALTVASQLLAIQGMMTILAYPGHLGGMEETDAVKAWCEQLNKQSFSVQVIDSSTEQPTAPKLFVLKKLA